jgi:hypothetical protein
MTPHELAAKIAATNPTLPFKIFQFRDEAVAGGLAILVTDNYGDIYAGDWLRPHSGTQEEGCSSFMLYRNSNGSICFESKEKFEQACNAAYDMGLYIKETLSVDVKTEWLYASDDDGYYRIVTDLPSAPFPIKDAEGYTISEGLVIDLNAFDQYAKPVSFTQSQAA